MVPRRFSRGPGCPVAPWIGGKRTPGVTTEAALDRHLFMLAIFMASALYRPVSCSAPGTGPGSLVCRRCSGVALVNLLCVAFDVVVFCSDQLHSGSGISYSPRVPGALRSVFPILLFQFSWPLQRYASLRPDSCRSTRVAGLLPPQLRSVSNTSRCVHRSASVVVQVTCVCCIHPTSCFGVLLRHLASAFCLGVSLWHFAFAVRLLLSVPTSL